MNGTTDMSHAIGVLSGEWKRLSDAKNAASTLVGYYDFVMEQSDPSKADYALASERREWAFDEMRRLLHLRETMKSAIFRLENDQDEEESEG